MTTVLSLKSNSSLPPNSHVYKLSPLREAALRSSAQLSVTPAVAQPSVTTGKVSGPTNKPTPGSSPVVRGSVTAKVFKRDILKKHTTMTAELLDSLKGSGLFSMAEVVNHLMSHSQTLTNSNDSVMSEVSQLQLENRRLREDVQRYRDDVSRLSAELRSFRDPYNAYDSGRGGTSRGWPSSDPYDRGYGYERRY